MISGIYTIENRSTGAVYVGSSVNVDRRFAHHRSQLNRGVHDNTYLQNSWRKHGDSAFRFAILEECESDLLRALEQYWINLVEPVFNLVRTPIRGGLAGFSHTAESRSLMSQRKRGKRYGAAYREACRRRVLGSKQSRETIRKRAMNNPNRRPVICIDTGVVYESAKAAANSHGLDSSSIGKCCRGKLHKTGNLRWAYAA